MTDGEAAITEEMVKEEQELQEAAVEKEALRTRDERELSREESLARLQRLLRASNCYSQFLFQRIQQQKQERTTRPQKKRLREINGNSLSSTPGKAENRQAKRLNSASPEQPAGKRMRGKTTEPPTTACSEDSKGGEVAAASTCDEAQPALFTGGVLRPYQMEGFNWLKLLCENGVNGILGDEMGLGKTAQVLALLAHLMEQGVRGPFLVVGPLTAVPQWVSEAKRFVPTMSSLLYHGPERRNLGPEKLSQTNLVATSYEVAMRDASRLAKVAWRLLVVDEGHRLKNARCRLAKSLRLLRSDGRILLTGTPLQNSLAELWALLHFLLPEIFSDIDAFQSWFDVDALSGGDDGEARLVAQEQKDHVIATMQEILRPFLLRRTKEEVCIQLPRKKEVLVWAPMSPLQQEYYTACVNRSIELLLARNKQPEDDTSRELNLAGRPKRRVANVVCYDERRYDVSDTDEDEPKINVSVTEEEAEEPAKEVVRVSGDRNPLMDLRKICSHPYLVRCPLEDEVIACNEELVQSSGKLRLLDAMLLQLKKRGHKVLLFSQMTRMLDLLEVYCSLRKFQYCRLDGKMPAHERQPEIDIFNSDARKFVFLLSTRAGGLGLNLTSADTVVLYDSDWNPQCDAQASARCHRIGQTRPVVIYRLVTRGTIDQRMVEIATAKRKLERLIMQKGKFSFQRTTGRSALSPQELLELLKSTDAANIVHADSPVLSSEDMEALLDRSETLSCHDGVFQLVKNEEEDISNIH